MGLMKRFSDVMKAKTSKMLDKAEDPRETLDYSYEKQLEMVQKVRRGLADVATSRKRLELQQTQLKASADKLEQQARTAVGVGNEDLAREALNRRAGVQSQLDGIDAQRAAIQAQLDALTAGSSVDAELAKMKAELGAGAPPPKEIGASGEESK